MTFFKVFKSFALDSGKMDKHIVAFTCFNKAKSFFGIEPFNYTYHFKTSFT
ncbi:hypothetical protein DCCM_0533 [Desulfocucumis palustris]|uniref:Uncharacterized protein n=1 Tax=Desulfocucumis palustris TaxID=1898651 RepID=A0A2L2X824_9FIRM|nr:hypothetical protein DCCM_0533 [Desulfocucumis palustris]